MTDAVRRGRGPDDVGPSLQQAFPGRRFLVVSNREPYEHRWDDARDEVIVARPAGGLISALDPLLQVVGGTWIAWGSGELDAAVVDARQRVLVPPEDPQYTLHRVWLNEQDLNHYYFGYANQFLWPMCHLRPALTRLRSRYWERYREVNERFAEAVLSELGGSDQRAAVWFQDYHLATAPALVRQRRPDATLAHFWHIPFPPLELFRMASQGPQLLEGLLANDLVGFHLPLFCDNFLRSAEAVLGLEVDWNRRRVIRDGHSCHVRAFPISIDVAAMQAAATIPSAEARLVRLRERFVRPGTQLGIGVDRIDYSKGLEEKLKALDLMWETRPDLRERLTYVQIAAPSRTGIDAYDWLSEKLERMVWSINDRHGTQDWRPVYLLKEAVPAERLALYYRAADLAVVSSLQDGMNLVAKEFVACQLDDPGGVLVLSKFAGAAAELDGAIEVNPFDPEAFAHSIAEAILLEPGERRERLKRLHGTLRTIYDWMVEVFEVWSAAAAGGEVPLAEADSWRRTR